ncbi:MAG: shikimate kinase [Chloroflexota bacterium]|jgi:shikimate kinase|nr:shikimate kinase [Chloroflexota bacterium]
MAAEAHKRRLILIGMMGSGKTTVGSLLSLATGWQYVDNDELVRRLTGRSARQVLEERGEQRLRKVETDALRLGTELSGPIIVGVAAGTILDQANRDRLRQAGLVVWLRTDPAVLRKRAASATHRPFVDTDLDWIARTAEERAPLYAEVADLVVDTDATSPDESVRIIQEAIGAVE